MLNNRTGHELESWVSIPFRHVFYTHIPKSQSPIENMKQDIVSFNFTYMIARMQPPNASAIWLHSWFVGSHLVQLSS
jgi:hypothetical protein